MNEEKRQTLFLILLLIVIILLVISLVVLIKNKNLIMKDTLIYGMELHNFTSCSCYDSENTLWVSGETSFTTQKINIGDVWPKKK